MAYGTPLRFQGAPLRSGRPVVCAHALLNIGARTGVEALRRRGAAMPVWTSKVAAQFGRHRPRPPGSR